ncbi:hypothetical protein Sjap_001417 [Stephania japonica]|uniref:Uncharacterized protein n=1 Tax=Stephania japonica TaxID=461633 RepID=A0AAP0PRN3_9MAGN
MLVATDEMKKVLWTVRLKSERKTVQNGVFLSSKAFYIEYRLAHIPRQSCRAHQRVERALHGPCEIATWQEENCGGASCCIGALWRT